MKNKRDGEKRMRERQTHDTLYKNQVELTMLALFGSQDSLSHSHFLARFLPGFEDFSILGSEWFRGLCWLVDP
jgi:hypothetical protein